MSVSLRWDEEQFAYFDELMNKESGWDYQAKNPSSSATGIPQALVITHKLGDEYLNDPYYQVGWAIDYIDNTYGTPQVAMNHSHVHNWY